MHTRTKHESPSDKKGMRGVAIKCMKAPDAPKKKPPLLRLSDSVVGDRLPGVAHVLCWAREHVRRDLRAELDRTDVRSGVHSLVTAAAREQYAQLSAHSALAALNGRVGSN